MARPRIVALYSDLGLGDVRAGVLRGVVQTLAPESVVLDVCHHVRPGDVHEAAYFLLSAVPFLPRGTIHACLVGDVPAGVAVRVGGHTLLAPDAGVLAPVTEALGGVAERRFLTNTRLHRAHRGTATLLGRDVIGPVAAQLVRGIDFSQVGEETASIRDLPGFAPTTTPDRVTGRVLHTDAAGTIVTNLVAADLAGGPELWDVRLADGRAVPRLVAGGIGFLEVPVERGLPRDRVPGAENGSAVVAVRRNA